MRVRIVSDGTAPNTHITDLETGQDLTDVVRIDFALEVNQKQGAVTLHRLATNQDGSKAFPRRVAPEVAEVAELDVQGEVTQ